MKRHIVLMRRYVQLKPKNHLALHLVARIGFHGNPTFYTTFTDESFNKELKRALRNCSQLTFERSAFVKMNRSLQLQEKRRRM